jgi:hypothetical protein
MHRRETHTVYYEIIMARSLIHVRSNALGEKRNAYRILVGKPEGKRPRGRRRRRWVDNIKKDLREIGWDGMDWIHIAKDGDR